MKKVFVALGLTLVMGASFPAAVSAGQQSEIAQARAATARFHDIEVARAEGYQQISPCRESPAGGMGFHYGNFSLMDATIDPAHPEVILYEPSPDGLRLVAVEYFIAEANASVHPVLFGRQFSGPMDGHGPGMPRHYDLHVWLWKHNPEGMFAEWNPKVSCS